MGREVGGDRRVANGEGRALAGSFRYHDTRVHGAVLRVAQSAPITRSKLLNAFSRFGEIEDVYVPVDKDTHRHKGLAFISYLTRACANAAVRATNGMVLDDTTEIFTSIAVPRQAAGAGADQDGGQSPAQRRGASQEGRMVRRIAEHGAREDDNSISRDVSGRARDYRPREVDLQRRSPSPDDDDDAAWDALRERFKRYCEKYGVQYGLSRL